MTTTPPGPVLSLEHAEKSFGAVHALEDGDVQLFAGEVHGLVGENGAGKSTLVKILAGVHRPDAGRLMLDGEEAIFDNAKQSQAAGIAIIFQEPTLFPDLTVAENIFVGVQPLKRFRRIDGRRMRREAAAVFEQLGVRLDPDRLARGLSIADQQLVEIAKALTTNAAVIVMDEPTAALTSTEVDRLFRIVETLRERGSAVLFVSHRLEEIFAICQQVTVMRDGTHVLTKPIEADDASCPGDGRPRHGRSSRRFSGAGSGGERRPADARGRVHRRLLRRPRRESCFARARRRQEDRRPCDLRDRPLGRQVSRDLRQELPPGSPTAAMAAGIALVPEDRRQRGLVMDFSISATSRSRRSTACAAAA